MRTLFSLLLMSSLYGFSQETNYNHEKIDVKKANEANAVMAANAIFEDRWDVLAQPKFWKTIMQLSPDTFLINVSSTRQILEVIAVRDWNAQTEAQKESHKDSLRLLHGLSDTERLFVTSGKNDFYKFDAVYPSISQGVEAFERYGADPWYAQAILLIESPGQLKKSNAGAYGAFQLMPGVARNQGLTVNKYRDEREDFDRSAYASSRLIRTICVPEAKRILSSHNIAFKETDLWFRLFVLHIYHAGAGNVAAVVAKIAPTEGGQSLITQMWQTNAASFGNNSQNYTQLALASQLILHEMIYSSCDYVFECVENLKDETPEKKQ